MVQIPVDFPLHFISFHLLAGHRWYWHRAYLDRNVSLAAMRLAALAGEQVEEQDQRWEDPFPLAGGDIFRTLHRHNPTSVTRTRPLRTVTTFYETPSSPTTPPPTPSPTSSPPTAPNTRARPTSHPATPPTKVSTLSELKGLRSHPKVHSPRGTGLRGLAAKRPSRRQHQGQTTSLATPRSEETVGRETRREADDTHPA